MKTEIEKLLITYPDLEYEDGYLYAHPDEEGYLYNNSGVPLDGKHLIEEAYEGRDIPSWRTNSNPMQQDYVPGTGREYIEYAFEGDYSKALKSL